LDIKSSSKVLEKKLQRYLLGIIPKKTYKIKNIVLKFLEKLSKEFAEHNSYNFLI
jgi:hypothetical protein